MSKNPSNSKVPSYRLHRQSGQGVCTLTDGTGGRRDVLLGKYGTKESRQEYARVISEWEASDSCRSLSELPCKRVNRQTPGGWRLSERVNSREMNVSGGSCARW